MHGMDATRRWPTLAALCLLLAGCGATGEGEAGASPADEARAKAMLGEYRAARAAGNPERAEAAADRLRGRYPDSAAAGQLEPTLAQVRAEAEALRETRRLRGLWDYQANALGKGSQRSATISSRTAAAGEDEPAPLPDAQLVLRDHPDWGRSAYLLLAQSKFECGKPCRMRIGFDGAPPAAWAGKQADSGQGPALFIEDEPRFVRALAGAKLLRIELPPGSGRIPVLVFEVGGYAPERYARP
jgi:hypothetical protein